MRNLRHFKTDAEYQAALAEGMELPNVCSVEDTNEVHYNELRNFKPRILYSDMTSSKLIIPGKTPIAIEVIPGKHMEDGKTRWMSLVNMSTKTPEIGSIQTGNNGNSSNPASGIYYGQHSKTIEGLENTINIPYFNIPKSTSASSLIGKTKEEIQAVLDSVGLTKEIQGSASYAIYIPYDVKFNTNTNEGITKLYGKDKFDLAAKMLMINADYDEESGVNSISTSNKYLHSPFNSDGTPNLLYRSNNADGSKSPLGDFDGKGNTDKLISAVTVDWSGATIPNSYSAGNAPAACCCRRFHTEGTNAGDWYQPAMGELGYIMPNLQALNDVLQKLIEAGITAVKIGDYNTWSNDGLGNYLVSSSSYSGTYCWYLGTLSGSCSYFYRGDSFYSSRVRAFLSF